MAATRIVRELLAADMVAEDSSAQPRKSKKKNVGRPKTGLRIVPGSFHAVGITVSAYHSEVSICDGLGNRRAARQFDALPFGSVEEAGRFYANELRELIESESIEIDRIVGIGVALSARTAPDKGEIVKSEYFGWSHDGGAFCQEIQKILNLPVEIENIANAMAIAEMRFGAARNVGEFVLVHAATFVGASLVSEGRIVRGKTGISGLIGHLRAEPRNLTCVCGRNDCLNLCATGFGLLSELGKLDHTAFDSGKVSQYASSLLAILKDRKASQSIAETGGRLAPALDCTAKLLGPQLVIVSGYLGSNPTYFNGVRAALEREFGYAPDASYKLVRGTIASDKSAALLALHAFCYSDRLDFERFEGATATPGASHG